MQISESFTPDSQDSLLAICLFAAFADGAKTDTEREGIRRLADELGSENLSRLSREILMRKLPLETVAGRLQNAHERLLGYEMALGVCEADGSVSAEERAFLDELHGLLGLGEAELREVEDEVAALALAPVEAPPPVPMAPPASSTGPENGGMILRYAILNGALELLPDTLATVAIIPLQMKMVYRIGRSHGFELDRTHIKDFLATAGIGMGSQVLEGFARKLMKGFGKKLGGKTGGRMADQATGSAFSFATTYALGHVAESYYAGGRRLDAAALQASFGPLRQQAEALHAQHLPQITEQARNLNPASLLSLVRQGSV